LPKIEGCTVPGGSIDFDWALSRWYLEKGRRRCGQTDYVSPKISKNRELLPQRDEVV